jgi:hypothetical protein
VGSSKRAARRRRAADLDGWRVLFRKARKNVAAGIYATSTAPALFDAATLDKLRALIDAAPPPVPRVVIVTPSLDALAVELAGAGVWLDAAERSGRESVRGIPVHVVPGTTRPRVVSAEAWEAANARIFPLPFPPTTEPPK